METLTPGQIAMSVDFNPGGREDVKALNQIFADAYDAVHKWVSTAADKAIASETGDNPQAERVNRIYRWAAIARTHLEEGQMAAVKAVTR